MKNLETDLKRGRDCIMNELLQPNCIAIESTDRVPFHWSSFDLVLLGLR
jgi:hypothetical protein